MSDSEAPPGATDNQELPTQPIRAREPAPAPGWPRGYVWRDPATGEERVLAPQDVSLIVGPDPETDDQAPPTVSLFRRLDIGPGDVLVAETPHPLTQVNADLARAYLAKYFPGVPVAIVGDGMKLYVVSAAPAREQIDVSTLGEAPGSVTVEGRLPVGQCPMCGLADVLLDSSGRVGPHGYRSGAGPCNGTGRYPHPDLRFP